MEEGIWQKSMNDDVDSDGRPLFTEIKTEATGHAEDGNVSNHIRYPVIRDLSFTPEYMDEGESLLKKVLHYFKGEPRIYAFFHYFGMSASTRHGKLHEKERHVAQLLKNHGFVAEHENVYYSRQLTASDTADGQIRLDWKDRSAGNCREFAASMAGQEIGWGQVHFLPQGDIAYLRWIYMDEKRQHTGLGTAVMKQLFRELYRMGIRRFDTDTAQSNSAAQGYYEKNGFTNCGITK